MIVHAENRRLGRPLRGFKPDQFLFIRDSDLLTSISGLITRPFSSCSNRAILDELVYPEVYRDILWLTGNENAPAKLIDALEKKWINNFIYEGGKFFLSGNNVAIEFGASNGNRNDLDFGESQLGISGSDSLKDIQFSINGYQLLGLKPDTPPHFAFHQAIRPIISNKSGQIITAYRKNKTPSGIATVFSASFSLGDVEPDQGLTSILQLFRSISDDGPLTPEPSKPITSIALINGQILYRISGITDQVICTIYDTSRAIIRSDTLDSKNPIEVPVERPRFLRLQALNGGLAGKPSPLVSGYIKPGDKPSILIVDGFERRTPANKRDFIIEHTVVLQDLGYSYDTVTNQAVLDSLVSLSGYDLIDWILGEESSNGHTFTNQEQKILSDYVMHGGRLLVSGSEIGWDLEARAQTITDSLFLHELFGVHFIDDNAGTDQIYLVSNASESESFYFGRTYPVSYPDVFKILDNGTEMMRYPNGKTASGGKKHIGGGKAVIIGFPLETVQPFNKRRQLFRYLLDYLEDIK